MTYICHTEIDIARKNELKCYCQCWGGGGGGCIKRALNTLNIKLAHNNLN